MTKIGRNVIRALNRRIQNPPLIIALLMVAIAVQLLCGIANVLTPGAFNMVVGVLDLFSAFVLISFALEYIWTGDS